MKCERCGERPAVVRYTEVSDGEVRPQRICAECAAALGFGPVAPSSTGSPVPTPAPVAKDHAPGGEPPSGSGSGSEEAGVLRCPGCGLSAAEFSETSLFGCPCCYETFDEDLDLLLKRLHGAVSHRGRLPAGRPASGREDPARLRRELDEALQSGDYEQAARLRDRLRQIERGPGSSGGAGRAGAAG